MRRFRYVLIDHTTSEVEFGLLESFVPPPDGSWQCYPLTLEDGNGTEPEVIIEIPIAGRTRRAMIDTAAAWNLYLEPSAWDDFSDGVEIIETSRSRSKMFRGWTDIEKVIVGQFQVGPKVLPIGTIAVVDESANWRSGTMLLGMANFLDTAITLDFEHNRFWIRHPQTFQ